MKTSYTMTMTWRLLLLSLFLSVPQLSLAAQLYIDPQEMTYGPGDTFVARVRIDNAGECINAARVEVLYPTTHLRAVDFSKGSSIFSLWVEEPHIDTREGKITFSGGIPGGYCGRVPGDPVVSNILGRIVFTALSGDGVATIEPTLASEVYLNDGTGQKASLTTQGGSVTFVPTPTGAQNTWVDEVGEDTVPPEPFAIEVQSTRGIFGGKYYVVFSTVDKQSGLDHFEIYERGAWKTVSSPHQLRDQSPETIALKAIDKGGNERMGDFDASAIPERQTTLQDQALLLLGLLPLILAGLIVWYRERKQRTALVQTDSPSEHQA